MLHYCLKKIMDSNKNNNNIPWHGVGFRCDRQHFQKGLEFNQFCHLIQDASSVMKGCTNETEAYH